MRAVEEDSSDYDKKVKIAYSKSPTREFNEAMVFETALSKEQHLVGV